MLFIAADAFFKSAISLIPEAPATVELDNKNKSTEPFLVSYISNLLSTLLLVPVSLMFCRFHFFKFVQLMPHHNGFLFSTQKSFFLRQIMKFLQLKMKSLKICTCSTYSIKIRILKSISIQKQHLFPKEIIWNTFWIFP